MPNRIEYSKFLLNEKITNVELLPPCTYCGDPITEDDLPWEEKFTYSVKERVQEERNSLSREENDSQWKTVYRNITLKVPYCRKHQEVPKPVAILRKMSQALFLALTIGLVGGIVAMLARDGATNLLEKGIRFVLLGLIATGIAYAIVALSRMIAHGILVMSKPELRGFPNTFDFLIHQEGHWGLEVDMIDNICSLRLTFYNPDSAHRFKDAFPQWEEL